MGTMPLANRFSLAVVMVLAVCGPELPAQAPFVERPTPYQSRRPESSREAHHREALKLYGQGLLCERGNRLLEATQTFEKAVQLDPNAVVVHKALIPLYLALDRGDDALAACRKTLALDADDYETWFLCARQLKDQGHAAEALEALVRGGNCRELKGRPDLEVQVFFEIAVMYEEAHNYDRALQAFTKAARVLDHPAALMELGPYNREDIDAKAAETHERIGKVALEVKQYDRAVKAFLQAQKKDPNRAARLYYNLAKVRLAQEHFADSLTYLDQYLKTQPPGTDGYECKIEVLRKLGRVDDILPMLEQASRRDTHNLALKLLLAGKYAEAGNALEAKDLYLAVAAEAPAPDVYRGLFALYQSQGRTDQALDLLDHALAAASDKENGNRPGDRAAAAQARAMLTALRDNGELVKAVLPEVRKKLEHGDKLEHETRRLLAVLAARAHQLDTAEQLFRTCLEDPRLSAQSESALYDGLLQVLNQARKYKEVVQVCEKGLQHAQATNRLMFYIDLARALAQLGKAEEAIKAVDQAVELADDGNRFYTRYIRAVVLSQAERYDRAIAECQALLKDFHEPKQIRTARYELSGVYSAMGDQAKSEEQLRLILKEDPNDATANNDLGYLWADHGKNLEQAEEMIRKAIRLDREQRKAGGPGGAADEEEHAAYLDSLGWVLFRRGRMDAARQQLERAAALPDGAEDPVIWDHLGDVQFKAGESEGALKAWQKAVRLYEEEKRRKPDEQYRELKRKLKLLQAETQR